MREPDRRYCPLDIVGEPSTLGMRAELLDTAFGALRLVRPEAPRPGRAATLFLHGVGGSWRAWTPLLQEVAHRGHDWGELLLLDLPGFGDSENRLPHLEARVLGEELIRALGRLGYPALHLVGHSMGGFLALDMASHGHPELRSVAAISGAYYSVVDTVQHPLRALSQTPGATLSYLTLACLSQLGPAGPALTRGAHGLRLLAPLLGHVVAQPNRLRPSVLEHLSRSVRPASFRLAAKNGLQYDCRARWSRIDIPLWASFGSADRLVPPEDKARLEADLPSARTEMLEGVGHFAPLERPDLVAASLESFRKHRGMRTAKDAGY